MEVQLTRSERRARTKKILKRRLKIGGGLIFGLDAKKKEQPHRMAKHKPKFTSDRGSLKYLKQAANRSARHAARLAIMVGKEPPHIAPSVRWDYW